MPFCAAVCVTSKAMSPSALMLGSLIKVRNTRITTVPESLSAGLVMPVIEASAGRFSGVGPLRASSTAWVAAWALVLAPRASAMPIHSLRIISGLPSCG